MRKRSHGSGRLVVGACLTVAGATGAWLSASSVSVPQHPVPMTVRGVVAGTFFTPPAGAAASSTVPSHYEGARVCVDLNDNAVCDSNEPTTLTDTTGRFVLSSLNAGPLVAEVLTTSTNSAGEDKGVKTDKGANGDADVVNVFRASFDQIAEGAAGAGKEGPVSADVVITPLSTEVVRMMEADGLEYWKAKLNLATRLTVPVEQVLRDLGDATAGTNRGRG